MVIKTLNIQFTKEELYPIKNQKIEESLSWDKFMIKLFNFYMENKEQDD